MADAAREVVQLVASITEEKEVCECYKWHTNVL